MYDDGAEGRRYSSSSSTRGSSMRNMYGLGIFAGIMTLLIVAAIVIGVVVGVLNNVPHRPAPPPDDDLPPVPQLGEYCAYAPLDMDSWNTSCPSVSNNTFCESWPDITDPEQPCVFEVCTVSIFGDTSNDGPTLTGSNPSPLNFNEYLPVRIFGSNSTIKLPGLIAKFMEDNFDVDPPQPFDEAANFTAAGYSNTSFATSAKFLTTVVLAAQWSIAWKAKYDLNATRALVYVPSRCTVDPDVYDLTNMTWLNGNNVPVYAVNVLARCMMGINFACEPGTNATLGLELCNTCMASVDDDWPNACDTLFGEGGQYPWLELTDYEASSHTFWIDMYTLASLFVNGFQGCYFPAPGGYKCFGVVPPTT